MELPARAITKSGEGARARTEADKVRVEPPFGLDPGWKERRVWARRREVAVGLGAYLTLTWEGRGILFALVCGALGGWAVIGGLIQSP